VSDYIGYSRHFEVQITDLYKLVMNFTFYIILCYGSTLIGALSNVIRYLIAAVCESRLIMFHEVRSTPNDNKIMEVFLSLLIGNSAKLG